MKTADPLITISISREVFDDCLVSTPSFRRAVIDNYTNPVEARPEMIHRDLIRMMKENIGPASPFIRSGAPELNKIGFIKAIREDSRNGRMADYTRTFPGFLTGSNIEAMGLADAKKLAEHYVLHFRNHI